LANDEFGMGSTFAVAPGERKDRKKNAGGEKEEKKGRGRLNVEGDNHGPKGSFQALPRTRWPKQSNSGDIILLFRVHFRRIRAGKQAKLVNKPANKALCTRKGGTKIGKNKEPGMVLSPSYTTR